MGAPGPKARIFGIREKVFFRAWYLVIEKVPSCEISGSYRGSGLRVGGTGHLDFTYGFLYANPTNWGLCYYRRKSLIFFYLHVYMK